MYRLNSIVVVPTCFSRYWD